MDFFAIIDGTLFAQDPAVSLEPFSIKPATPHSSASPQSDIPVDEDRSGSGGFTGFCVIS